MVPLVLLSVSVDYLFWVLLFQAQTTNGSDNAILSGNLNKNLGANIAGAVLPLGLPETSLGDLITALANQDTAALLAVPGISPDIISAAVGALKSTYSVAFRWVWVAAGSFTVVAAIGKYIAASDDMIGG